jgi:hypothetical protein
VKNKCKYFLYLLLINLQVTLAVFSQENPDSSQREKPPEIISQESIDSQQTMIKKVDKDSLSRKKDKSEFDEQLRTQSSKLEKLEQKLSSLENEISTLREPPTNTFLTYINLLLVIFSVGGIVFTFIYFKNNANIIAAQILKTENELKNELGGLERQMKTMPKVNKGFSNDEVATLRSELDELREEIHATKGNSRESKVTPSNDFWNKTDTLVGGTKRISKSLNSMIDLYNDCLFSPSIVKELETIFSPRRLGVKNVRDRINEPHISPVLIGDSTGDNWLVEIENKAYCVPRLPLVLHDVNRENGAIDWIYQTEGYKRGIRYVVVKLKNPATLKKYDTETWIVDERNKGKVELKEYD